MILEEYFRLEAEMDHILLCLFLDGRETDTNSLVEYAYEVFANYEKLTVKEVTKKLKTYNWKILERE